MDQPLPRALVRVKLDFVRGRLVLNLGIANSTISQIKNLRQGIAGGFGGIEH
jgi:hypothetical protein